VNAFGVGARYSLSKRTILYTSYDRWNLKGGAQGQAFAGYGTVANGIADASNNGLYTSANTLDASGRPNVNPYSFQFGIRHSF
jgi:predicted porin